MVWSQACRHEHARSARWPPRAIQVRCIRAGTPHIVRCRSASAASSSAGQQAASPKNENRQLDGTTLLTPSLTPRVAVTPPLEMLTLGDQFTCGLSTSRTVYCWGDTDEGEAGTGADGDFHAPDAVPSLASAVVAVASGYNHVCASTPTSTWCWGDGREGQLGAAPNGVCANATDGMIACAKTPMVVATPFAPVVEFAAGFEHTCARSADGRVACWAMNSVGQCGQLPLQTMLPPSEIPLFTDVAELASGQHHTCARKLDGSVWCWGRGNAGQLGRGSNAPSATPVQVQVTGVMTQIASHAFANTTCALRVDGTAWCWGDNAFGQSGDGTTGNALVPRQVRPRCSLDSSP